MTRRQSNNQWSGGIAAHTVPKNIPSANIRWKSSRLDFLGSRRHPPQTINAEYYSSLLVQLKDILKEKRSGKLTNGVLFWHVNAPAHRALATEEKPAYLGFQRLDHPTHSPDLAPSDCHLFPRLKKQFKGRDFSSDAGVMLPRRLGWTDKVMIVSFWVV